MNTKKKLIYKYLSPCARARACFSAPPLPTGPKCGSRAYVSGGGSVRFCSLSPVVIIVSMRVLHTAISN